MTPPLSDLNILALDCQATGASPGKGHLLEIGWVKTRAAKVTAPAALQAESYLVSLPAGVGIPPAVKRITGISVESMTAALPEKHVWQKLADAASAVAESNQLPSGLVVIHFARFEKPFLTALYRKSNSPCRFPFQLICTHEIAKRLLPNLPRRGLRAMAGYFGHSIPELRRSRDHAVATAVIWRHIVELLKTACDVVSLEQLVQWMKSESRKAKPGRSYPMSPEIRLKLADKPGIYRMLRSNGDLLYIGKAKSLKKRVNSYFRPSAAHAEHILEMLTQARGIDFTPTGSALEAAILESDQIKKHSPPYNIALRKRQRKLVFFSKDLKQSSHAADENHPVGPLPSGKLCGALPAFAGLLEEGLPVDDEKIAGFIDQFLGLPIEYAPGIDCLREGFGAFQRQHQKIFCCQNALRALTCLGARLWRERLEAPATDVPGNEDTDEQAIPAAEGRVWTPENVVRSMEAMIRHGAHMIRRARWLCRLSESSLAWQSPNGDENMVIVFEKGDPIFCTKLKLIQKPPAPPGHTSPFQVRRQHFDVAVYDRLRVATTELRRLIHEMRATELCLGPRLILRNRQLQKILPWV